MENISKQKYLKFWFITSSWLHILAMFFMLLDHMWASVIPWHLRMNILWRLAFPIFAFLVVEWFYKTSNIKKYMLRMLLFSLISEIPFDYFYWWTFFYPFHQNVIRWLLLWLIWVYLVDKIKNTNKWFFKYFKIALIVLICSFLGLIFMIDFYMVWILTVFVFYFFRRITWYWVVCQILILYYINMEFIGWLTYKYSIFWYDIEIVQQSLAVFALIPILLYNWKRGINSKYFQYFCYIFYPLHMLILYFL